MPFYKVPFLLGELELSSNVFCSPLAGCSDYPFRKMLTKYRPGLVFCEMVKMDALIRHDLGTYRLLDFDKDMHPIGAQLCGSKPELAGPCAKIIEDLGFDVIDLNCGCPVDKITKDQSGSGLLKNPNKIGDILANMVAAVRIPVTVKIRAGWDEAHIVGPEIAEIAEKAGAKILFVHGRTRAQAYKGPANWDYIKQCKEAAKNILIFGNGDILDAESAEAMFNQTKCDGLLVSRGSFGQPWIFEDIARHFEGETAIIRSGEEIRDELLKHLDITLQYQTKQKAALDLRRFGSWYLKKGQGAKKMREMMAKAEDMDKVKEEISNFDWAEIL